MKNKLASHAISEPILGAFVLKKVLPLLEPQEIEEFVTRLSDEDFDEFVLILQGMGFKEQEIKQLFT